MARVKIFLFFLFQITFVFSNAISSRSSYFTTRENNQLKGYVVKRFDSPSLLSCSQQCMRNAWCTSTNYKTSSKKDGKGTCELNKHDISLVNEDISLDDHQGVTLSILLKGCLIANCLNGGSCLPDKEKQTFSCFCRPPWTGDRCEVKKECPQDWVLYRNSCYHVIDTLTFNWNDARTTCQNLGGDLAIMRSEDENNFIRDLAKQQIDQDWRVWLGGYRKADDMFHWIDDTPLAGQYSAWASGEPNSRDEGCVLIYVTSRKNKEGQWNDLNCNSKIAVLCQKKYI